VKRYAWELMCNHRVLADTPPAKDERCYCPSCGFLMQVLDHDVFMDEEAAAWRP
jgi:hypothetical protein